MTRRIVSLWLPRLGTDRLRRRRGNAADRPLVVIGDTGAGGRGDGSGGRRFVVAVDAAAEQAGITPGMPLASAQALVPSLVAVARDPARERALVRRLARWSERYTPLVAIDGDDGLLLDVTGSAHLFGGEPALVAELPARLAAGGLTARVALAATAGAARALARWGVSGTILASGETAAGIAALPVEALGLDAETTADLVRLGLRRIGDLYPLPRAALADRFGARRFGSSLLDRLDRALGRIPQPLSPQRFAAPWRQCVRFAEPATDRTRLARALDLGLERLCRRLRQEARGARRLRCTFDRLAAPPQAVEIGTARPVRDPLHLARLFAAPLETLSAAHGVEAVTVEVLRTEPLPPEQTQAPEMQAPGSDRFDAARRAAGSPEDSRLADLIDRLGNRLGFDRIVRFRPLSSHLPEHVYAAVPAGEVAGAGDAATAWPAAPGPRPVRLLATPEPIEVLARRPPADAAAPPSLFRVRATRQVAYRVAAAIGPERICWAWWRDDPDWRASLRDYWRIEDADGRRFWLFRRLPEPETELAAAEEVEAEAPAWFLHGFFP